MPYSTTKRVETKYDTLPATANNDILLAIWVTAANGRNRWHWEPSENFCFLRGFRFPEKKLLLGSFVSYFILTDSGVSLITRRANGVLG